MPYTSLCSLNTEVGHILGSIGRLSRLACRGDTSHTQLFENRNSEKVPSHCRSYTGLD